MVLGRLGHALRNTRAAVVLIQRLKGREVLVRRFCYRGKLMLSALTEKLVRGRK